MAGGFVEEDCRCGGGVERFDARRHGDADASVGAALDFFGEAAPFIADEEGHGLAPIHFPRREQGLITLGGFARA